MEKRFLQVYSVWFSASRLALLTLRCACCPRPLSFELCSIHTALGAPSKRFSISHVAELARERSIAPRRLIINYIYTEYQPALLELHSHCTICEFGCDFNRFASLIRV